MSEQHARAAFEAFYRERLPDADFTRPIWNVEWSIWWAAWQASRAAGQPEVCAICGHREHWSGCPVIASAQPEAVVCRHGLMIFNENSCVACNADKSQVSK